MKSVFVIATLIIFATSLASGQMTGKENFRNSKVERELKKVEEEWAQRICAT